MNCKKNLVVGLGLLLLLGQGVLAQTDLDYQNRGNRYEGIKPKPVSGYDIELISVLADYKEEISALPDQIKIRFYLERPSTVFLTVRELDYKLYYWLDRVMPPNPWQAGFGNEFSWGTDVVLRRLDRNMPMYDLGVLARLSRQEPASDERVTPAILYSATIPALVTGYLFTLKTHGDARLSCSIYKEGEMKPLSSQEFRRERGGRPFAVHWDASKAEAGDYRLVVSGYFLDTNQPVHQIVRFYHKPTVK